MTDLSAEDRARECLEQETGYGFYSQAEFDHSLFKGAEVVRALIAFEAAAIERAAKVAEERALGRERLFNENGASINAAKSVEAEEIAQAIRSLSTDGGGGEG